MEASGICKNMDALRTGFDFCPSDLPSHAFVATYLDFKSGSSCGIWGLLLENLKDKTCHASGVYPHTFILTWT